MGAKITTVGWEGVLLGARKGKIDTELVEFLHSAGDELAADIKGGAFTRIQRRAMTTVHSRDIGHGVEVSGGRGGLGGTLFAGGEFGGRASRKKHVSGYVYGRGPGYVTRRTTMMFLPHLGKEGYVFWPAVRDWLPSLRRDATRVVERVVARR